MMTGSLHVWPWSTDLENSSRKLLLIQTAYTFPAASVSICGSACQPVTSRGTNETWPKVAPPSLETFKAIEGMSQRGHGSGPRPLKRVVTM